MSLLKGIQMINGGRRSPFYKTAVKSTSNYFSTTSTSANPNSRVGLNQVNSAQLQHILTKLKLNIDESLFNMSELDGDLISRLENNGELKELGIDLPSLKFKKLLANVVDFKLNGVALELFDGGHKAPNETVQSGELFKETGVAMPHTPPYTLPVLFFNLSQDQLRVPYVVNVLRGLREEVNTHVTRVHGNKMKFNALVLYIHDCLGDIERTTVDELIVGECLSIISSLTHHKNINNEINQHRAENVQYFINCHTLSVLSKLLGSEKFSSNEWIANAAALAQRNLTSDTLPTTLPAIKDVISVAYKTLAMYPTDTLMVVNTLGTITNLLKNSVRSENGGNLVTQTLAERQYVQLLSVSLATNIRDVDIVESILYSMCILSAKDDIFHVMTKNNLWSLLVNDLLIKYKSDVNVMELFCRLIYAVSENLDTSVILASEGFVEILEEIYLLHTVEGGECAVKWCPLAIRRMTFDADIA